MMTFSEWITKKYIEWRGDRFGPGTSVAKFAETFGASHQLVSEWMKPNGKVPRSQKYINALVAAYGEEVYDVLGLSRPDAPDRFAGRVRVAVREMVDRLNSEGVDPGSEEGERIIAEVSVKFGLTAKHTSKD